MELATADAVQPREGEAAFILQLRPPQSADAEALASGLERFTSLFLERAVSDQVRFSPLGALTWALCAPADHVDDVDAACDELGSTLFGDPASEAVHLARQPDLPRQEDYRIQNQALSDEEGEAAMQDMVEDEWGLDDESGEVALDDSAIDIDALEASDNDWDLAKSIDDDPVVVLDEAADAPEIEGEAEPDTFDVEAESEPPAEPETFEIETEAEAEAEADKFDVELETEADEALDVEAETESTDAFDMDADTVSADLVDERSDPVEPDDVCAESEVEAEQAFANQEEPEPELAPEPELDAEEGFELAAPQGDGDDLSDDEEGFRFDEPQASEDTSPLDEGDADDDFVLAREAHEEAIDLDEAAPEIELEHVLEEALDEINATSRIWDENADTIDIDDIAASALHETRLGSQVDIAAELSAFREEMKAIAQSIPSGGMDAALSDFRAGLETLSGEIGQRVDGAAQRIESAVGQLDVDRYDAASQRVESAATLMETSVQEALQALKRASSAMATPSASDMFEEQGQESL